MKQLFRHFSYYEMSLDFSEAEGLFPPGRKSGTCSRVVVTFLNTAETSESCKYLIILNRSKVYSKN